MTRRQTAPGGAIGIVGAGRMAQALGRLLFQHGQPIVVMASRSRSKARRAARFVGPSVRAVDLSQLPAQADRLIVAVADDALFEVAGTLAEAGMDAGMIIHTSGVWGPEVFSRLMEQGVSCASMHPLQTVANPKQGVEKLPGSTFAVAGKGKAALWAKELVKLLDGQVLTIKPLAKPLYHAAAVVASNYIVTLIDAALLMMVKAGVSEGQGRKALEPLVLSSVQNALKRGTVEALTGPIERGDGQTVAAHLTALKALPKSVQGLYRALGQHTVQLSRKRGLSNVQATQLEELLEGKAG